MNRNEENEDINTLMNDLLSGNLNVRIHDVREFGGQTIVNLQYDFDPATLFHLQELFNNNDRNNTVRINNTLGSVSAFRLTGRDGTTRMNLYESRFNRNPWSTAAEVLYNMYEVLENQTDDLMFNSDLGSGTWNLLMGLYSAMAGNEEERDTILDSTIMLTLRFNTDDFRDIEMELESHIDENLMNYASPPTDVNDEFDIAFEDIFTNAGEQDVLGINNAANNVPFQEAFETFDDEEFANYLDARLGINQNEELPLEEEEDVTTRRGRVIHKPKKFDDYFTIFK
jgi:hypothetical protein